MNPLFCSHPTGQHRISTTKKSLRGSIGKLGPRPTRRSISAVLGCEISQGRRTKIRMPPPRKSFSDSCGGIARNSLRTPRELLHLRISLRNLSETARGIPKSWEIESHRNPNGRKGSPRICKDSIVMDRCRAMMKPDWRRGLQRRLLRF